MLEATLLDALHELAARLDKQPINWAITASCGLALQGGPVSVRDVDLATDAAGAYRLAQRFAGEMVRPVRFSGTETIQSHYGAFVLAGYDFEIIGAAQYPRVDGTWEPPQEITPHKHYVRVDGMTLPVLTLEYELASYVRLGRKAKVELLAQWLGKR